ncbi:MAG: hypothetical protein II085_04110 [Alphaproteobacteria bacterium]|nr:hypothetical protein [Alphaproteobacteria bacterium]
MCSSHYIEHAIEVKNNVQSIEKIYVLDDDDKTNNEVEYVSDKNGDIEKHISRARSLDETALIDIRQAQQAIQKVL